MEHNIWIVRSRTSWCVYWSSSPLLDIRTWLFHYNIYFAQSLTLACLVSAKYIVYLIWPGLTNKTYFTYIITNIYYSLTPWLAQTRHDFAGCAGYVRFCAWNTRSVQLQREVSMAENIPVIIIIEFHVAFRSFGTKLALTRLKNLGRSIISIWASALFLIPTRVF